MSTQLDLFSFKKYYPITSVSREELLNTESVILGHFTSSIFIDSILSRGLIAQSETNIQSVGGHTNINDYEYIYLTREFDTFFSEKSVEKFQGKEILIIVNIPTNLLETDPFGGNTTSTNLEEILYVINKTQRNFRVHKKIERNMIIAIYDVSDLKAHNLLSNSSYNPIPYSLVHHKLNNMLPL